MSQEKWSATRAATLTSEKVEYEFVLSGHIDEADRQKLEAIVLHLRKVTGDTTLTFLKVEPGSIKLTLEGTEEGFSTLESLITSGKLKQVSGFTVQAIRRTDLAKSSSSSTSIKPDDSGGEQKVALNIPDELYRQFNASSGLLLTPNLFINSFISARDSDRSLAMMTIESLVTNNDEYYSKIWMTPLDKELLVIYLEEYSNIIGYRRKKEVERILNKVGTLPTSDALKSIAIENSKIQLADALRLEAAFAHNLTLLTWEPNHFSKDPT